MRAHDLIAAATAAGIEPLRTRSAESGDGSVFAVPYRSAARHGLSIAGPGPGEGESSPAVYVASLQAVYEHTPEGTNDGLRDGSSYSRTSGPQSIYYAASDLRAAGIEP